MGDTIKLFELNIDVDAAIKSTSKLKTDADNLKKTLNELKKSGDTNSETYVRLEAAYKNVNKQYNASQQEIGKLLQLQGKQIKTIEQGRNALSIINKEWAKQAELYGENSAEVEKLSKKKLELTERLKELESATGDNTRNVGAYKQSIKEALGDVTSFKGGLGGMITGLKGATKASLAFIATPIGAVLAVLVGVFALVKSAMNRSEDATNKIKKAFSAFQGITNTLLKFLQPLGEFLIDGLVKGFELAEKAIYKGLDTIASGLELLGFDDAAKKLRNFNAEVQQGAADAKALADAEAQLEKSQRLAQKTQLDYQKQAERLRQIRDDESLSIKQRVAANEELGKTLQKQLESELAIAEQALIVANLRIQAEGKTKSTLDAQAEALTRIADIQERITGQESEQLTNRNALYKEATEKAREAADKAIEIQKEALDKYIAQQGVRKRTLQEQLNLDEKVAKKSIEILDAELKNKNISQEKYDAEYLKIQNKLAESRANVVVENAQLELDNYIKTNQSKLDSDKFFSDEALKIEQDRLDAIAQKQREFAQKQLDEGVINQTEYNAAIQAIDEENQIKKDEALLARKQAQAEADAIDLENQRVLDEERLAYDAGLQLQYLEKQKQQELESAEKTGADKSKIESKYAKIANDIEETVQSNKLQLASSTFGNLATIFGKQSAVGKAAAIAQTTIDTYQSATSAYKAMSGIPVVGPALGAIAAAAAVASGIANVKKITSTKQPDFKAEKGALFEIGGKRHAQGGTKFYGEDGTRFEAEQGELIGVMNRNAAALFMDFNNQHNTGNGAMPNYFADGGIVQRSVQGNIPINQPSVNINQIDYQLMKETFIDSVRELPPPVTSVEDIIGQVSSYNQVVNGANI